MCEFNNKTGIGSNQVILNVPDFIIKSNRTVCIDSCIVQQIKELWENNIYTLSCCCGHGDRPPSIVVGDGYGINGIKNIEKILSFCDSRKWDILQWKIEKVN